MADNPFRDAGGGSGGNGPMKPGDVRHLHARDKKTGEITKTYTLHRTDREYVHDLCDAYNAGLDRADVEWAVTDNGELKLHNKPDTLAAEYALNARRQGRDRDEWMRRNQLGPYAEQPR